ncbi:MAG: metallophosphoesterase [Myxococcota bacterium]
MKLLALSDLHLNHRGNREALESLTPRPDDWLLVPGDVAEKPEDVAWAWDILVPRFAQVLWVPGNHELWSTRESDDAPALRGKQKYDALVTLCRSHGVLTPEDPYPVFHGESGPVAIALLFLLYDYSFRPDDVPYEDVIQWAAEDGVRCSDESMLAYEPYESRRAWSEARVAATLPRLEAAARDYETVLVNHWPLRRDTIWIPRIPRFTPWCGTRASEDWHLRFRARAVVSGHLHVRSRRWIDNVRFEEVSLGYPKHWKRAKGIDHYVREILPGETTPHRIPRFFR